MKKKIGTIKLVTCLGLIFLLNINSFAAKISDNDGSAFITKAEFDSLKNNFQSQIDSYNQSIDSKIDNSISSYLKGIKINKKTTLVNQYKSLGTDIMFGKVPFNETKNNKVYSINCAGCYYSNGYTQGSRMSVSNFQGNKDNIGTDGANNAFNWATFEDGKYFYLQKSIKTYIATYYNITGSAYLNVNSVDFNVNLANGDGLGAMVKQWSTSDDWSWNQKMVFSNYIYSKSTKWPDESDYIRGNIVQVWQPGALTDTSYYAQSFLLTNDDKYNDLIIKAKDDKDYCGSKANFNPNLALGWVNGEAVGAQSVKFDGNIAYYPVKTTKVNLTNLYQKIVKDKIGMEVRLYEGLPLFKTKEKGKATFDCTLYNTDAGNVNLYFRDMLFSNTDANTGKAGLNGSYLVDNGDTDVEKWDKYNFSDGAITLSVASGGTKIRVIFDAEKDKNYYFKLVPSSSTKFAWMSDCSDITYEIVD